MDLHLVLPVLIPLWTAIIMLLAPRRPRIQRLLSLIGAGGLLLVAIGLIRTVWLHGIQVTQIGGWPAPFGITLVADMFSALMVGVSGLVAIAVAVYSLGTVERARERFGYYPLYQILLMGVCGSFLTGDLFNLYVWFEVMLIASFVLLTLGGEQPQIEGAIKYFTLNLVSSALLLAAVGLTYGTIGALNMADLSRRLAEMPSGGLATALAVLFLVAFGIKAAVFPLFFWLPASYHTPPPAVSAIFAGLLTKVGVYALIRVFTLLFIHDAGYTHTLILIISGLTMITGVLGAMAQNDFRRILSFHIVSQIGYMIMGLGLFTRLALAASVFYIVHHIVVKTNLFLVSGVVLRIQGSGELKRLGGLYAAFPLLAALFMIPALSLAGVPPLSGFFAKLFLVKAGLDIGQYAIVAAALGVSMMTLYSMTKIWTEAFWKGAPLPAAERAASGLAPMSRPGMLTLLSPIILLAAVTIGIGLGAEPFFALANRAAEELMDPSRYIQAVLR